MTDPVTVYHTATGIYKTGRYQSTGSRWYGKMKENGMMGFLKKEDFDFATKPPEPEKRPELDPLPF